MQLDIRYAIGLLFGLLGLIITVYGALTKHLTLDININLLWGLVLLVFGMVMLLLARHARTRKTSQNSKSE